MTISGDISKRKALLRGWLARRLPADKLAWLDERLARIESGATAGDLAMAIGLVPRKLGKSDLSLDAAELTAGARLRPGLDASAWSVDQAARIALVLASYSGDDAAFVLRLEALFQGGEIGEHIAFFLGFPLYPAQEQLVARAAEGIRSAVQPVFEAVAHRNPYPKERFSEQQWNQMVVKALFIGSRLAPVQGLDERRNAELAEMLIDYAHERRAAGRPVSPELWRCVGPFAGEAEVREIAALLTSENDAEAGAAALALAECPLPAAVAALKSAPALSVGIREGHITWDQIS